MQHLNLLTVILLSFTLAYAQDVRRKGEKEKPKKNEKPAPKPQEPPALKPAVLSGQIVDGETGEGLAGVEVRLAGTRFGAMTDENGRFNVQNLSPGLYDVSFNYISYQPMTVEKVKIESGKETKIQAPLMPEGVKLEAVEIRATMRAASDAALIQLQRNEIHVSDGYSGDMILNQTPDFQVSTVLRRMPGLALLEDKQLVIRGLPERYNLTILNGALLPITDIERSAFDFSVIPSNLLSGVRLLKSATPDLISEFSGGIVQLNTVDIPERNLFRVAAQGLYNSRASFRRTYFAPTDRRIAGIFPAPRPFPDPLPPPDVVNSAAETGDVRLAFARSLPRAIHTDTAFTPLGQNLNLTWQRRGTLFGQDAGFTFFANYLNQHTGEYLRINVLETYDPELKRCLAFDTSSSNLYRHHTALSGMLNGGVKFGGRGSLSMRNFFSFNYENMAADAYGAYVSQYDTAFTFTDYYVNPMRFTLSRTYSGQLDGGWKFKSARPDMGTHFKWGANYTVTANQTPFYRAANYADYHDGRGYVYEYYAANWLNMFSGRQKAEVFGGFADVETPLRFGKVRAKVRTGVYLNVRSRLFRSRLTQHNVVLDSTDTPLDENLPYEILALSNIRRVLADENFGPGAFTASDSTTDFHNYNAVAANPAGYAGLDLRFPYRIRVGLGARVEHFRQTIALFPTTGASQYNYFDRSQTDFLPSATLIYSPNDKTNFRAAFSQTVIRPNDRDLVPLPFLSLLYGVYTIGNPAILRTQSYNYDLRYEWFPSGTEIVSASLFYKRLLTPIEQHITAGSIKEGGQITYEFTNSARADAMGLELEVRQNLGRLANSSYLENFVVYGNATLMRSRVNGQSLLRPGRSLQGQADVVLNLGLIFTEPKSQVSIAVFYNRVSRRIALVGVGDTIFPSIYEMPRNVLDFQFSRTFFNRLSVRLAVSDVINQPIRWVHIYSGNPNVDAFDPKRDQYIRYTRLGLNANLTVGYSF
jgi:hypothetical protein